MNPLRFKFLAAALIAVLVPNFATAETTKCSVRNVVLATEGSKFEPFKSFETVIATEGILSLEIGNRVKGFEIDILNKVFEKLPCYSAKVIHLYDSVGEVTYLDPKTNESVKKSKGPIDFPALFVNLNQLKKTQDSSTEPTYVWDLTFASTSIKQERREKFNIEFSSPYHKARKHFFGKIELNTFPQDLQGKKVGVKAGTNFDSYVQFINNHLVQNNLKAIKIVKFDDVGAPAFDKIFESLLKSEIDLTLSDDEFFESQKKKDSRLATYNLVGPELFNKETFASEQFGEGVGFAFRKTDTVFLKDFNDSLSALMADCGPNGFKAIYDKYFSSKSDLLVHCEK